MFKLPFEHRGFVKYLANTNWMFLGQLFSLVVSFFVGAWLGRYLGPQNYGVLNYITTFVGVFSFIAGLGIENIIVKQIVETKEKTNSILGTSFVLRLAGGLVAVASMLIAAFTLRVDSTYILWMFIFSLHLVIQAAQITAYYFQANVSARYNTRALIYATIFTSLLKISFIVFQFPFWTIFAIFMLDSLWQAIGLIFIYKRKVGDFKSWNFDWSLGSNILNKSWYLMFASAVSFMLLRIDQIIIKYYLGETKLGIYAAAVKFAEVWYFVPTVICASLFPAILNARKMDIRYFMRRMYGLYGLLLVLALVISVTTYLIAKIAITSLFGLAYLNSVPIIELYIWSNLGLFLNIAINQYLIVEGRYKAVLQMNLAAVFLCVSLNFIFIPAFALKGAAFATLISYTLVPVAVAIYEFVLFSVSNRPRSG